MIKTFKCANCSATISYEGGPEQGVVCSYCEHTTPVPANLRPQYDPVHEQMTDRPHPDHAPARPVRVSLRWSAMSSVARIVVILVVIFFVFPFCLGMCSAIASIVFSLLGAPAGS